MNLQSLLLLGCTLALTTVSAVTKAESKPVPYRYGMPIEVKKVIAMTEQQTRECKVITAEMKFLDKAGEVQHISYKKLSEACLFQN